MNAHTLRRILLATSSIAALTLAPSIALADGGGGLDMKISPSIQFDEDVEDESDDDEFMPNGFVGMAYTSNPFYGDAYARFGSDNTIRYRTPSFGPITDYNLDLSYAGGGSEADDDDEFGHSLSIGIGYHFSPDLRLRYSFESDDEEEDLADDRWGRSIDLDYGLGTSTRFQIETSPFGDSAGETREEGDHQEAASEPDEISSKEKTIRKVVERALENEEYRRTIERYGSEEVKERLREALEEREKQQTQQAEGGDEKTEEAKSELTPDPEGDARKREQIEKSVRKALRDPAYRRMIERFGSEDVKEAVRRAVDAQQSAGG